MGIHVFWLEPTELERVWLRRYRSDRAYTPDGESVARPGCPLPMGYHDKSALLCDERPRADHPIGDPELLERDGVFGLPSKDDARWPTHCDCGFAFGADDEWQVFPLRLYRGAPDGKLYTLRDAPAGAMWDATFGRHEMGDPWTGPDGISLVVKLPNGSDWCVDQQASNCTRDQWGQKPGEEPGRYWLGRTHYCWIRHGDPRSGILHVDKNGDTCAAGAGSIQSGSYHGFLHNGELTSC